MRTAGHDQPAGIPVVVLNHLRGQRTPQLLDELHATLLVNPHQHLVKAIEDEHGAVVAYLVEDDVGGDGPCRFLFPGAFHHVVDEPFEFR